jgi:hypothetical protein
VFDPPFPLLSVLPGSVVRGSVLRVSLFPVVLYFLWCSLPVSEPHANSWPRHVRRSSARLGPVLASTPRPGGGSGLHRGAERATTFRALLDARRPRLRLLNDLCCLREELYLAAKRKSWFSGTDFLCHPDVTPGSQIGRARPRTAQAAAVRAIEPSAPAGRRSRSNSRNAVRPAAVRDIRYAGAGPCPPRNGCQ